MLFKTTLLTLIKCNILTPCKIITYKNSIRMNWSKITAKIITRDPPLLSNITIPAIPIITLNNNLISMLERNLIVAQSHLTKINHQIFPDTIIKWLNHLKRILLDHFNSKKTRNHNQILFLHQRIALIKFYIIPTSILL